MFHFSFDFFLLLLAFLQLYAVNGCPEGKIWSSLPELALQKAIGKKYYPSDCGVSNGIPYPKITQKIILCSCWEEREGSHKWLLFLLFMSDSAHLFMKYQIDLSESQQSLVPELCFSFAGEVWGCAQTNLSFLYYKHMVKWYSLSGGGNRTFHSLGLAALASCAQLRTSPAAESPGSPFLRKDRCLGLKPSWQPPTERSSTKDSRPRMWDPRFHHHHCSITELERLSCRQNLR